MHRPVNAVFILGSVVSELSSFVAAIAGPLRYLFRAGDFGKAVLRMWINLFIWSIFACLVFPLLLSATTEYRQEPFDIFPEPPGVLAYLVMGWFPSLIICTLGKVAHAIFSYFSRSQGKGVGNLQ
jgi:hypothetical protein